ncbi:hypothetical protein [Streptococcus lutetiensis]|uniref:hypothetical protein n=1 Tax=Streptococcus lutetiensis TaxID=150055 RepID=UPI001965523C|nr:hypothetical protein [Streptococcus lutetiensis]
MKKTKNEVVFNSLLENELELSKAVIEAVTEYNNGNYTAREAMKVINKATFKYSSNRVIYQAVFENLKDDEG